MVYDNALAKNKSRVYKGIFLDYVKRICTVQIELRFIIYKF